MPQKFPKPTEQKLNFRRNLVKHHKLVGHYDTFFAKEINGLTFKLEPKQNDRGWHPSSHCLAPPSQLYYYATHHGEKAIHGASLNKVFAVGHFWHQVLQYATVQMDLCDASAIERRGFHGWGLNKLKPGFDTQEFARNYGAETVWQKWHYATGQGDIAPITLGNRDYVVDFKTMNSRDFKVAGGGAIPEWAAGKYEAQVNIYMDFFNLEHALIVGVQKDSPHDFCEVEFERNQPLIDWVYSKWEFAAECIAAKSPPTQGDDLLFDIDPGLFGGPVVT